jgi:hypothetical protein
MATPNEEASLKTRIQQAKTFLQMHDNETIATTARTVSEPTISSNNEYFEEPCNCSRICKKLKQHEAPPQSRPKKTRKDWPVQRGYNECDSKVITRKAQRIEAGSGSLGS